jgi:thiamine phosphate synthase YjbQ (UPF0047 family)
MSSARINSSQYRAAEDLQTVLVRTAASHPKWLEHSKTQLCKRDAHLSTILCGLLFRETSLGTRIV